MILLQQQGYTGSDRTLTRYLSSVRADRGLLPSRVKPTKGLAQVSDPQSWTRITHQTFYSDFVAGLVLSIVHFHQKLGRTH